MRNYLFGSKLLKLENAHDEDCVVFIDKKGKEIKEKGCRSIPTTRLVINHFIEGKKIDQNFHHATMMYQNSSLFMNDPEYPFNEFNIFEHVEIWKKWLKAYISCSDTEICATRTNILPKHFYHLLYQYYMITENTHWISDEAKVNVQKIHDLEMPSTYFYELRDLINSL